jgi:hypothetical protein
MKERAESDIVFTRVRKQTMKITEADIVWVPASADVPNAGSIRVERHGSGWRRTAGDRWVPAASFSRVTSKDSNLQLLAMFITFNTIVVRDGIDPQAAHRALLTIDEYRQSISRDMQGAED